MHQSHGTAVFNSSIIVFREGLEAVLIFAAVTASFIGGNRARRRPVVLGAACAFAASVVAWFVAQAVLDAGELAGPEARGHHRLPRDRRAALVLNWFVHKVYWSEWIGRHHRQRRKLLARTGAAATLGLVALGFTSVFREGFEVVLFLQTLQLQNGTSTVLEGVAIGLAATALVGVAVFHLHRRLPYRKMLVLTGVLVGAVLVVMIGGTALTFSELGWIPQHAALHLPAVARLLVRDLPVLRDDRRAAVRRLVRRRLVLPGRVPQGHAAGQAGRAARRALDRTA